MVKDIMMIISSHLCFCSFHVRVLATCATTHVDRFEKSVGCKITTKPRRKYFTEDAMQHPINHRVSVETFFDFDE